MVSMITNRWSARSIQRLIPGQVLRFVYHRCTAVYHRVPHLLSMPHDPWTTLASIRVGIPPPRVIYRPTPANSEKNPAFQNLRIGPDFRPPPHPIPYPILQIPSGSPSGRSKRSMAGAGRYITRGGGIPTLIDARVVQGSWGIDNMCGIRQYNIMVVYGWYTKRNDCSEIL